MIPDEIQSTCKIIFAQKTGETMEEYNYLPGVGLMVQVEVIMILWSCIWGNCIQ